MKPERRLSHDAAALTTRRAWLLGVVVGVVGSGCVQSATTARGVATRSRSNGRPVVVLGAGLAGLVTALELVDRGVEVVVLEAQSRPGGRIHTVRAPFSQGLYVEAGATHVGGDPDLLAVVARAGVKLVRPRPPHGLASVSVRGGRRTRVASGEDPPRAPLFTEEEERLGFRGRLEKYFADMARVDARAPWPPPSLARHDSQSGAELLAERGASPAYIADFGTAMVGEHIEDVSAAFVLREMAGFFLDSSREGGGRIEGGADRLPAALAALLGARVRYGSEVKRIEQDALGARVSFTRAGAVEHLDADRIVCAIPYSVLRHVETPASFSPMKKRAIQELRMVSVARVFAQLDRRIWIERGDEGDAETDLPTGNVRDETKLEPGNAGVLGAYLSNDAARRFTALPFTERMPAFLAGVEQAHPGATQHFVAGAMKCWDEEPFARGAYAWFARGEMTAFGPAMATPEGRVHFAGDHTSHRPGWMHGAVASAKRAAAEVLAART